MPYWMGCSTLGGVAEPCCTNHGPRALGGPIIPQHDECDLRPPASPRYETFETVSMGLMARGVSVLRSGH